MRSGKRGEGNKNGEFILYNSADGKRKVEAFFRDETVWLTQKKMAKLFDVQVPDISKHLANIFADEELDKASTVSILEIVQNEGGRSVTRKVEYYNLDAILSVGYRVNSKVAIAFRRWATERLKEYIIKGFAIDDERLKEAGGGDYWKELLDRIRDIRSSEKVMYRQVLDLYATSIDYDPKDARTTEFFKIIQNKLHFATHGRTVAELIFERADAEKEFMGLTSFAGDFPARRDVAIAKNYLNETELKILNNLVSAYFDLAENQALRHRPMRMKDYVEQLDKLLVAHDSKVLENAGKVSHEKAVDKALKEYRKFEQQNLSPVEKAYLDNLIALSRKKPK